MADKKKSSFIKRTWEAIINTALLWPRAILATTTYAGQLLRNLLATDVNGWQSLNYKQSIKNYGKKLSYALSAPITAFSPKLKQKRGKLDKVPGPKERNKDMVRYDYMGRTSGRLGKYAPQLAIDAWLLWSEWLESMLYLDKESPMYTGPWPTITQKLKNFGKSIIMPFEPIFRRSQNKLWLFGGKKKAKAEAKQVEEVKKIEVPKVEEVKKPIESPKPETKKVDEPKKIDQTSDKNTESSASKPSDTPPKTIDEIKKQDKAKSEKKDKDEQDEKFPKRSTLAPKFKDAYRKDYKITLDNNPTKEWIVARVKKAKMWEKPEEIIGNFKKIDPTFAGYMEEEILNKAA